MDVLSTWAVVVIACATYVFMGYWVHQVYYEEAPSGDKYEARAILFGIFWPLAIVYGFVYLIQNFVKLIKTACPGKDKTVAAKENK